MFTPGPKIEAVETHGVSAKRKRTPAARILQDYPEISFVLMTFLWSWSIWLFLVLRGISYDLRIWKYLYVAGLSGPLVASVAITFVTGGFAGVRRLVAKALIWKFSPVWYLIGLFLIPLLML